MIDLLSIPLYYISFNKSKELESYYKDNGFKDVNHFQAVDGRKFNVDNLRRKNIISVRTYIDLLNGRISHYGIPTMGAIGCTMSHYSLWKLCVNQQLPYIIIAEDDNVFIDDFKSIDHEEISNAISKDAGLFISTTIYGDYIRVFTGTHFYIASKKACYELVEMCFPMDVQTDWYMSNMYTIGKIDITGFEISYQNNSIPSSIQSTKHMVYEDYKMRQRKLNKRLIIIIIILIVIIIIMKFYRYNCEK